LCTRKKIVFDVFVSIYQTMAFDRNAISVKGVWAGCAKYMDKLSCRLVDVVLTNTNQTAEYFIRNYNLDRNKFIRVLVGSDDSIMFPRYSENQGDFIVHFHGEFQKLHDVEYIIEAASLLPVIKFQIIGYGRTLKQCLQKAKSLVAAIKRLKEDNLLRGRIAQNGYSFFKEHCSPEIIGEQIADVAKKLIIN